VIARKVILLLKLKTPSRVSTRIAEVIRHLVTIRQLKALLNWIAIHLMLMLMLTLLLLLLIEIRIGQWWRRSERRITTANHTLSRTRSPQCRRFHFRLDLELPRLTTHIRQLPLAAPITSGNRPVNTRLLLHQKAARIQIVLPQLGNHLVRYARRTRANLGRDLPHPAVPLLVLSAHKRVTLDQQLGTLSRIQLAQRRAQRRPLVIVLHVDVGARLDQQIRAPHIIHLGAPVQCRASLTIRRVHRHIVLDQQRYDLWHDAVGT